MKSGLAEKKCRVLQWMKGRGVLEVFYIQGFLDDLQTKIVHLRWLYTYGVGQGAQR